MDLLLRLHFWPWGKALRPFCTVHDYGLSVPWNFRTWLPYCASLPDFKYCFFLRSLFTGLLLWVFLFADVQGLQQHYVE